MTTHPMPLVQVFAPDGTLGDIPYDRLHDALGAGAKIAAKVKAPDGTVGFIPGDRVPDAMKAGATRVPLDMHDADGGRPGFWSQAWDKAVSMLPSKEDALRAVGGSGVTAYQLAKNPRATAGRLIQETPGLTQAAEYLRSRDAGNSTGRSALNAVGTMVGVDPAQEEADAKAGNTAGVAADAVVPAAAAIAGEALHLGAPKVGAAVSDTASKYKPSLLANADAIMHPTEIPGRVLKSVVENVIPDSPEVTAAKQRAIEEAQATEINKARAMQDVQIRREQTAKAKAAKEAAKPSAPFPPALGPDVPTPKQMAASQAFGATPEPASPIVTSQSPEIPSEGRPATWRNMTVSDLARQGGPLAFDAAKQAQLRQLGVPDVGLVADPRATVGGTGIGSSAERLARLRELAAPALKGGPMDFASQAEEPKWLYRTRDVGEKGVPNESRPNMTSSLDQAMSWLESRNAGTPQEIIRVDANSLNPSKLTARPFGEGVNWYRHEGAIPEGQVEVVVPHQEEVGNE